MGTSGKGAVCGGAFGVRELGRGRGGSRRQSTCRSTIAFSQSMVGCRGRSRKSLVPGWGCLGAGERARRWHSWSDQGRTTLIPSSPFWNKCQGGAAWGPTAGQWQDWNRNESPASLASGALPAPQPSRVSTVRTLMPEHFRYHPRLPQLLLPRPQKALQSSQGTCWPCRAQNSQEGVSLPSLLAHFPHQPSCLASE